MSKKIALSSLVYIVCAIQNIVFAEELVQIQFGALPDAVKSAVSGYVDKQRISKVSKISTDGAYVKFEIETDKIENNKTVLSQDILIASSGKIIKLTQEVPYFALPFEQMNEIEKRYPGIKVNEVESVQINYFDVLGAVKGEKVKFRIYANGVIEPIDLNQKQNIVH
jgi:hypothetical protein